MHIELHVIFIAIGIWLTSLAHMYICGKTFGYSIGNKTGVTNTLTMLEKYGILDIKTYELVIDRMRNEK